MNDPEKRIDVNLSSLLSLKAELLRKQAEVKSKSAQTIENFVPKREPRSEKPKKMKEKPHDKSQPQNVEEVEDSALLEKSRKVLEMKSRFYDRMAKSGGALNTDDNCLVMFNKKQQLCAEDRPPADESSESDDYDPEYPSTTAEDDWVEYTDCLGRTRQCLRKDLEFFKRKDTSLSEDIQPPRQDQSKDTEPVSEDDDDDIIGPLPPTMNHYPPPNEIQETAEDLKERMRLEWEKKERENNDKEFIHYQDVLFDEARSHGVSYYKFSTDADERVKQRAELDTLRSVTLSEQAKRDEARKARDKIIAERVLAAKNRQRARQGLPPLADKESTTKSTEELYDTTEEQHRKAEEERLKMEKEAEEKIREEERRNHIRPWDKGKSGIETNEPEGEWTYKIEKTPMSQEQWNTKQRDERPKEFAPFYIDTNPTVVAPPKNFTRRNTEYPQSEQIYEEPNRSLFFTTKKRSDPPQKPIPIDNEISEPSDVEDDDDNDGGYDSSQMLHKGAAIPPPPTFDYYGPTSSKRSRQHHQNPTKEKLEQSIEAGLKFLRNQSDKNASSGGKRVWTTKEDYHDH